MTAYSNIQDRSEEIVYKKQGKKYVPINDPWAYQGLSAGWWLVKVSDKGGISMRSTIYPRRAEIAAAARDKSESLIQIIREASEARPVKVEISPEALADWNALIAKHGQEFSHLQYPSFHDNAAKIIESLMCDKAPLGESYF
jgi:hypothetical protein